MKYLVEILMLCVLLALPALAQDPEAQTSKWSFMGLGSDDLAGGRLLYTPLTNFHIGAEASWEDGLKDGATEGWNLDMVGLYDLVNEAPLTIPLLGQEVPVTWDVGLKFGVTWYNGDANADARAWGLTGLWFGDQRAQAGIEYQGGIGPDMWDVLGPADSRLMGVLRYRF